MPGFSIMLQAPTNGFPKFDVTVSGEGPTPGVAVASFTDAELNDVADAICAALDSRYGAIGITVYSIDRTETEAVTVT